MRSLLDINVIIALIDPDHVFHDRAHAWWAGQQTQGWASCPLTENGLVRIMSNPAYSLRARLTPGDLIQRLSIFAEQTDHEFWPDSLSLREREWFLADRIHSSRHITDLYLAALAASRGGRLATFDESVPVSALPKVGSEHLVVI